MIVYKTKRFIKEPVPERFYIDKKELYELMIEYKKSDVISPRLALLINTLAQKLSKSYNFRNYHFIDDAVQDAVFNCIRYMHNFNPEKSDNVFGYFTQIIIRAFLVKIKSEKTYDGFKKNLFKYDENGYLNEENIEELMNNDNEYN